MPKETNIALNQRVETDSRIQAPGLEVAARPMDTVGFSSDSDQQVQNLLGAMGQFTGQAVKSSEIRSEQIIAGEKEKALMDSVKSAGEKPVLNSEQSAWYQKESMTLFGQSASARGLSALNEKIEALKADPVALAAVNPKDFMENWVKENVGAIDDPDVAKIVFPAMMSALPGKTDEIASAKRAMMVKQNEKAKAEALDAANTYANGELLTTVDDEGKPVVKLNDASLWATHTTLTAMLGGDSKKAMAILVDVVKNDVNLGRNLNGADVFNSRNPNGPRNRDGKGWSVIETLGADTASAKEAGAMVQFQTVERERLQEDARKRDEQQQETAYKTGLGGLRNQLAAYGTQPTLVQMSGLREWDKTEFIKDMSVKQADTDTHEQLKKEVVTGGVDRLVGSSQEKNQKAFDSVVSPILDTYLFDAKDPAIFKKGLALVFNLRESGGNSTVDLDMVSNKLKDVHLVPVPAPGQPADVKTQQALAVVQLAEENPSFAGMPAKVMSKESLLFTQRVYQAHRYEGLTLPEAIATAKLSFTDTAVRGTSRWLHTEGNMKKAEDLMIKNLESGYVFDIYAQSSKEFALRKFRDFAESQALITKDPKTLATMFSTHLMSTTVKVDDPDSGLMGMNRKARMFAVPLDEKGKPGFGARAGKAPFEQKEWGRAIELGEATATTQFQKDLGVNGVKSKYTFVSDFDRPNELQVYKNGSPVPGLTIPTQFVWDNYADNRGQSSRIPYVQVDYSAAGVEKVRAKYEEESNKKYGLIKEGRIASGNVVAAPSKEAPKKDLTKHKEYTGPAIAPVPFALPPEKGLGKAPRSDRWNEGMALPPATMAGGQLIPPRATSGSIPPLPKNWAGPALEPQPVQRK